MGIQWNSFLQGGFTTTGEVFSVQGRGKIFPVALRIGLVSPRNYSANAKKNIWRANELNIYFQGTIFCPELPDWTHFILQEGGLRPPYPIYDQCVFVVIAASLIDMEETQDIDIIVVFSSASCVDFCLFFSFFSTIGDSGKSIRNSS